MFANAISNLMIKPGNAPVFDHPKNHGLPCEEVSFEASDKVTLRGWLIPGDKNKVIIQSHFGVQCSRSGYSPEGKGLIKLRKDEISFLRQAKHLHEKGYTVLMYDLRNHGESDTGTCPWISWGPEEAKDVIAAVNYITKHPTYRDAEIGLLSICMGGSATTYGYGMERNGLKDVEAIKALMIIQPLTYRHFIKAMGIPGFISRPAARRSNERLGFDMNERTFLHDAKHINVPTLVLQNTNDPMTSLDFVEQYYDELTCEKELLWVDLAKDRAAAYDYLGTHPEVISGYFEKFITPN